MSGANSDEDLLNANADVEVKLKRKEDDKVLPPCGCGGKAVREQMFLLYSGKDVLMHSVRCPNHHVSTQDYAKEEDAEKAWILAMGRAK